MANEAIPPELAQRFAQASDDERQRLVAAYMAWIRQGARVGVWWTTPGALLIGVAALSLMGIPNSGLPIWTYALPAVAAFGGVLMFMRGGRKEKEWRAANPFRG